MEQTGWAKLSLDASCEACGDADSRRGDVMEIVFVVSRIGKVLG